MKVKKKQLSGHILERQAKQVLFQRMYNKLYAFAATGTEVYWTTVTDKTMVFLPKIIYEAPPTTTKKAA